MKKSLHEKAVEKSHRELCGRKNSFTMKLKDLYRELTKDPQDGVSFVANVIFERYGRNRKRMLSGLYRLWTGNGYVPMDIRFAPYTFDELVCSRRHAYMDDSFENDITVMKPSDLMRY